MVKQIFEEFILGVFETERVVSGVDYLGCLAQNLKRRDSEQVRENEATFDPKEAKKLHNETIEEEVEPWESSGGDSSGPNTRTIKKSVRGQFEDFESNEGVLAPIPTNKPIIHPHGSQNSYKKQKKDQNLHKGKSHKNTRYSPNSLESDPQGSSSTSRSPPRPESRPSKSRKRELPPRPSKRLKSAEKIRDYYNRLDCDSQRRQELLQLREDAYNRRYKAQSTSKSKSPDNSKNENLSKRRGKKKRIVRADDLGGAQGGVKMTPNHPNGRNLAGKAKRRKGLVRRENFVKNINKSQARRRRKGGENRDSPSPRIRDFSPDMEPEPICQKGGLEALKTDFKDKKEDSGAQQDELDDENVPVESKFAKKRRKMKKSKRSNFGKKQHPKAIPGTQSPHRDLNQAPKPHSHPQSHPKAPKNIKKSKNPKNSPKGSESCESDFNNESFNLDIINTELTSKTSPFKAKAVIRPPKAKIEDLNSRYQLAESRDDLMPEQRRLNLSEIDSLIEKRRKSPEKVIFGSSDNSSFKSVSSYVEGNEVSQSSPGKYIQVVEGSVDRSGPDFDQNSPGKENQKFEDCDQKKVIKSNLATLRGHNGRPRTEARVINFSAGTFAKPKSISKNKSQLTSIQSKKRSAGVFLGSIDQPLAFPRSKSKEKVGSRYSKNRDFEGSDTSPRPSRPLNRSRERQRIKQELDVIAGKLSKASTAKKLKTQKFAKKEPSSPVKRIHRYIQQGSVDFKQGIIKSSLLESDLTLKMAEEIESKKSLSGPKNAKNEFSEEPRSFVDRSIEDLLAEKGYSEPGAGRRLFDKLGGFGVFGGDSVTTRGERDREDRDLDESSVLRSHNFSSSLVKEENHLIDQIEQIEANESVSGGGRTHRGREESREASERSQGSKKGVVLGAGKMRNMSQKSISQGRSTSKKRLEEKRDRAGGQSQARILPNLKINKTVKNPKQAKKSKSGQFELNREDKQTKLGLNEPQNSQGSSKNSQKGQNGSFLGLKDLSEKQKAIDELKARVRSISHRKTCSLAATRQTLLTTRRRQKKAEKDPRLKIQEIANLSANPDILASKVAHSKKKTMVLKLKNRQIDQKSQNCENLRKSESYSIPIRDSNDVRVGVLSIAPDLISQVEILISNDENLQNAQKGKNQKIHQKAQKSTSRENSRHSYPQQGPRKGSGINSGADKANTKVPQNSVSSINFSDFQLQKLNRQDTNQLRGSDDTPKVKQSTGELSLGAYSSQRLGYDNLVRTDYNRDSGPVIQLQACKEGSVDVDRLERVVQSISSMAESGEKYLSKIEELIKFGGHLGHLGAVEDHDGVVLGKIKRNVAPDTQNFVKNNEKFERKNLKNLANFEPKNARNSSREVNKTSKASNHTKLTTNATIKDQNVQNPNLASNASSHYKTGLQANDSLSMNSLGSYAASKGTGKRHHPHFSSFVEKGKKSKKRRFKKDRKKDELEKRLRLQELEQLRSDAKFRKKTKAVNLKNPKKSKNSKTEKTGSTSYRMKRKGSRESRLGHHAKSKQIKLFKGPKRGGYRSKSKSNHSSSSAPKTPQNDHFSHTQGSNRGRGLKSARFERFDSQKSRSQNSKNGSIQGYSSSKKRNRQLNSGRKRRYRAKNSYNMSPGLGVELTSNSNLMKTWDQEESRFRANNHSQYPYHAGRPSTHSKRSKRAKSPYSKNMHLEPVCEVSRPLSFLSGKSGAQLTRGMEQNRTPLKKNQSRYFRRKNVNLKKRRSSRSSGKSGITDMKKSLVKERKRVVDHINKRLLEDLKKYRNKR